MNTKFFEKLEKHTLTEFFLGIKASSGKSFKKRILILLLLINITAFILPFAFILYLSLLILNIVYPIKIGILNNKSKITSVIPFLEPLARHLKLKKQKTLLIVINPGECPNLQLSKMYKRKLILLDDKSPLTRFLFIISYCFFFKYSRMSVDLKGNLVTKSFYAWEQKDPIIKFTEKEEKKGKLLLRKLGVPEGKEYVCIGFRENPYYEFLADKYKISKNNRRYLRSTFIRNPPLENYFPMIKALAKKGLCIIRMGQLTGKSLPILNPKIIDYATKFRTDFGDIYLLANCKFVIAGGAPGLWWISSAFNKPVVRTDCYETTILGVMRNHLFLPNNRWIEKEKRFFTLKELIEKGSYYSNEITCKKDGVKLMYNTPEEIYDVVQEMIERLDGTWKTTKKDKILQKKFKNLFKPHNPAHGTLGQIGTNFLQKYAHLIC